MLRICTVFLLIILNTSCGSDEKVAANEIIQKKNSTKFDKEVDSLSQAKYLDQIEISRINHSKNEKEIIQKFQTLPHIEVEIAAGAGGMFSPQFDIVNQSKKKGKEAMLKNLGSDDTLLNILTIFALGKNAIHDDRITNEKKRLQKMNAILEYHFCCTAHEVYLFREIFDSTTNGELKDLIERYIK
jgi:hypothetical protein